MKRKSEAGYAMLIMTAGVAMGSAIAVARMLPHYYNNAAISDETTSMALRAAKEALIARAVLGNTLGALPCPDRNGDGSNAEGCSSTTVTVGRVPWRTLGIPAPKDSAGECIWYALSPAYANVNRSNAQRAPIPGPGEAPQINPDTPGSLSLQTNPVQPQGAQTLVAVLIAPGVALERQERAPPGSDGICRRGDAEHFLDQFGLGWDNATGPNFLTGVLTPRFNDNAVGISRDDIFRLVARRVINTLAYGSETYSGQASGGGIQGLLRNTSVTAADLIGAHAGTGNQANSILKRSDTMFVNGEGISEELFRMLDTSLQPTTGAVGVDYANRGCPSYKFDDDDDGEAERSSSALPASALCFNDWYAYISAVPSAGNGLILSYGTAGGPYAYSVTVTP